ncbi:MAG TPA: restriction endonuclease [Patescibacteria group bacterium]|nr:restriction endonuclease [Patescibacteria group bacterium]
MAIPKYFEMYRPFLECLKNGRVHRIKEVKNFVACNMSVTEDEQKELLPSGKQAMFDNRIGWTRTYLKKAGLIHSPSRGTFILTEEGHRVLEENPAVINDDFLNRYESFRAFKNPSTIPGTQNNLIQSEDTPQDIFDKAFQQINASLADDLLSEIMKQTPDFFETLVVKLLEKMGYGGSLKNAGIVTGQSGDEGIDGIIREDKLGFSLIYIQAKRWDLDKSIGRPEIQKFVGALAGQGASKGLFITTAQFTKDAIEYAKKQHTTKVVLVDGAILTKLMIEYNIGVSLETAYEIKKIDTDFFNDEGN